MPLDQGYGQGKYVSERVIVAAVQAGLRATVVRVGQLSGVSTTGAWSLSEHVPIMLRSSIALGMIPKDLPVSVLCILSKNHVCFMMLTWVVLL